MFNKIYTWVCNHQTTFLTITNAVVAVGLLTAWAIDNVIIGRLAGLLFLTELVYLILNGLEKNTTKK